MAWITLTTRVTTPLFNGGHQPPPWAKDDAVRNAQRDDGTGATGVRVPSLRGALRFWFRAMMAPIVGNNIDALSACEAMVFGATGRSSPVKLRIPQPPSAKTMPYPQWLRDPGQARWISYLMGQGLSELNKNAAKRGFEYRSTRPFVPPEPTASFQLQLRPGDDPDTTVLVLASLWLLCRYGGLGARTRRGFGGLRIEAVNGADLPEPWTSASLCDARLSYAEGGEINLDRNGLPPELACCQPAIRRVIEKAGLDFESSPALSAARYPSFGGLHTFTARLSAKAFGRSPDGWVAVLAYAGEQFRWFRADFDTPGVRYQPQIKTREWIETINRESNRFSLGALGLPVVYKGGAVVNARRGGKELRRASPLWLRPIQIADGEWRLLSFAFLGEFLPTGTDVSLGPSGKRLIVNNDDLHERANRWITGLATNDHSFIR